MTVNRMRRARRGFTLLELLVVMFILVLLAGTVTALVMKRTEDAKHARAKADIASFETAIDLYKLDNQTYPPSLDALRVKPSGEETPNWNGPYVKKAIPADPWGRAYLYQTPGEHNPDAYDLFSLGKDGQEGGDGNDADILNWE